MFTSSRQTGTYQWMLVKQKGEPPAPTPPPSPTGYASITLLVVDITNWLWSSTNFKSSIHSCFVIYESAHCFVLFYVKEPIFLFWLVVDMQWVLFVFCARSRPTNKRNREQKPIYQNHWRWIDLFYQSLFLEYIPLIKSTRSYIRGPSGVLSNSVHVRPMIWAIFP